MTHFAGTWKESRFVAGATLLTRCRRDFVGAVRAVRAVGAVRAVVAVGAVGDRRSVPARRGR